MTNQFREGQPSLKVAAAMALTIVLVGCSNNEARDDLRSRALSADAGGPTILDKANDSDVTGLPGIDFGEYSSDIIKDAGPIGFELDVKPILTASCAQCHPMYVNESAVLLSAGEIAKRGASVNIGQSFSMPPGGMKLVEDFPVEYRRTIITFLSQKLGKIPAAPGSPEQKPDGQQGGTCESPTATWDGDCGVAKVVSRACASCHSTYLSQVSFVSARAQIKTRIAALNKSTSFGMPPVNSPQAAEMSDAERTAMESFLNSSAVTPTFPSAPVDTVNANAPGEPGLFLLDGDALASALSSVFNRPVSFSYAAHDIAGSFNLLAGNGRPLGAERVSQVTQDYVQLLRIQAGSYCASFISAEQTLLSQNSSAPRKFIQRVGRPTASDISGFMTAVFRAPPPNGALHAGAAEYAALFAVTDSSSVTLQKLRAVCQAVVTDPRFYIR